MEWDGKRYIGITLDWDYEQQQVNLSMPGYIAKALKVFQHKVRTKQDQPFPSAPIQYGTKTQYTKELATAPLLDAKGKKFIQQVCGKFLFLGRAVDATLLCPISAIASQSATPTEDTLEHTCWMNFLPFASIKGAVERSLAYCVLAPYWMGALEKGWFCSVRTSC